MFNLWILSIFFYSFTNDDRVKKKVTCTGTSEWLSETSTILIQIPIIHMY